METRNKIKNPLKSAIKAFVATYRRNRGVNTRYKIGLKFFRKITDSEDLMLDLGSGSSKRPNHIGIDLSKKADVSWDLSWGLPLPDKTVNEIRSDHFFEHLNMEIAFFVFQECHRVLKPGGVLDFTIPHLDPYIEAYEKGDLDFLSEKITDVPEERKDLYKTPLDYISWLLLREGDHRAIYDKTSIIHKVRKAGFKDISNREYEAERDLNYRYSSIYIKAIK